MRCAKLLSGSIEEVAARAQIYRLLARIWLCEVDHVFLRALKSPPLCDAFTEAGGILPSGDDQQTMDRLATAYCRLFLGPAGHLPPYQSVWQSGQFQTEAAVSMSAYVDMVGYKNDLLPRAIMVDNLGIQLDVMGHILAQISAWPPGNNEIDQGWEIADSFFNDHLLWPTDLFEAAIQLADHDFYRSSISLTRDFLKSETHI